MFNLGTLLLQNDVTHSGVIMGAMASQITSLTAYSGADQRKHQSPVSLTFLRGINRWPVNSPHKWPVMRKMFPFNDVIMRTASLVTYKWCSHTPDTSFNQIHCRLVEFYRCHQHVLNNCTFKWSELYKLVDFLFQFPIANWQIFKL